VFRFDEGLKVYLYREPVDFRMGINGLSILVEQAMALNPTDCSLYVFTDVVATVSGFSTGSATDSGFCSNDWRATTASPGLPMRHTSP
jgi:hypothetical protein